MLASRYYLLRMDGFLFGLLKIENPYEKACF